MVPRDLIITPVWNLRDHGKEGQKSGMWLNGLNIPSFKPPPIDFTEHCDEKFGQSTHGSKAVFDGEWTEMKFLWAKMQARLDVESVDQKVCEYELPDSKSVSTTIGANAHRISAGKRLKSCKESNYVFQVHAGKGWTTATSPNGQEYTFKWSKGGR